MSKCLTPLIVALDFAEREAAIRCVKMLDPTQCRVKIGKTLFVKYGPALVEAVQSKGFDVFLDLKFHDIPMQVAGAVRSAANLGVWMLSVHASGGAAMLEAAVDAADTDSGPRIIAITLLTSLSTEAIQAIGYRWSSAEEGVLQLAQLAQRAGVHGVVSSAQEARIIKSQVGSPFLCVTPGIRPQSASIDDQQRIMTPEAAMAAGSDYLVIGRPITQSDNPANALEKIILDINA